MKSITNVLGVALLALNLMACNSQAQVTNLASDEFEKGIAQANIQVLDVRTAGEYGNGHIKDALLADWNNPTQFTERTAALDKSKPVYVYCQAGGRSAAASAKLQTEGYTVYNLTGGMTAWRKGNKAVEGASNVKQMTMEEFKALVPADKTVLVDFSAVWCPPCKKMAPVVEQLKQNANGKYLVVEINGGEQAELCKALGIEAFPTFVVYKNGQETWRQQGVMEQDIISKQL